MPIGPYCANTDKYPQRDHYHEASAFQMETKSRSETSTEGSSS